MLYWHEEASRELKHKMPPGLVVATKADTLARRVGFARGQGVAAELGLGYMEVSAKTGLHVRELFTEVGEACLARHQ